MSADSPDGNALGRSKDSDSVNDNKAITLKLAGCAKASVLMDSLEATVQQLKEAIAATLGEAEAPSLPNAPRRIAIYSETALSPCAFVLGTEGELIAGCDAAPLKLILGGKRLQARSLASQT